MSLITLHEMYKSYWDNGQIKTVKEKYISNMI